MIHYIETHIVDHCNLKCRGCSHFSGLAEPNFKDLNDFEVEMRQLSLITNKHINIIRIMGGEPLLHPEYMSFLEITRDFFPSAQIVLVSNGILLSRISDDNIQKMNQDRIQLCISDYGLKLNQEKLSKFITHYAHNKNYLYNISLDLKGAQDINTAFYNCDLVHGGWYFFKDGRIYQCCIMANIDYFCDYFNKQIDIDLDDISINIFNHGLSEIEQFLKQPHQACRYCDTIKRKNTYQPFATSKGDIHEWITE